MQTGLSKSIRQRQHGHMFMGSRSGSFLGRVVGVCFGVGGRFPFCVMHLCLTVKTLPLPSSVVCRPSRKRRSCGHSEGLPPPVHCTHKKAAAHP